MPQLLFQELRHWPVSEAGLAPCRLFPAVRWSPWPCCGGPERIKAGSETTKVSGSAETVKQHGNCRFRKQASKALPQSISFLTYSTISLTVSISSKSESGMSRSKASSRSSRTSTSPLSSAVRSDLMAVSMLMRASSAFSCSARIAFTFAKFLLCS